MNLPAASCGVSKTPRNEASFGEYDPERLKTIYGEIFYTVKEAQVLIEKWRLEYNTFSPHRLLSYRPPALAHLPQYDVKFEKIGVEFLG